MNDATPNYCGNDATPWAVQPETTNESVLHLLQPGDFSDAWQAFAKWDGCINLSTVDDVQDVHICNVNEFIARLESLRDMARAHFGNKDWPTE